MIYDWEKEITDEVKNKIAEFAIGLLPPDVSIAGMAFANNETVEACFHASKDFLANDSMALADMSKDISGDAETAYESSLKNFWGETPHGLRGGTA